MTRKRDRKPDLKLVEPDGRPILTESEAKKRFLAYFAVKMTGLAALFGGVFLGRDGVTLAAGLLLLAGAVALFIRPHHLGLTPKIPRPRR
ncbi:hypothetical protein [Polymorphobacter sp.]|uniref:hypothetical protein n=1 Tax=Polymorphobacter sp. TaxID=1909290 RepID=UPI003F717EFF